MKMGYMTVMAAMGGMVAIMGCSNSVPDPVKTSDLPKEKESIAIYIVWDGSGSMADSVFNSGGAKESKDAISRRALKAIGDRLDQYIAMSPNRAIGLGIVILNKYSISHGGFGVADNTHKASDIISKWFIPSPDGGTPLGFAMQLASDQLALLKNVSNKHILVLTDGGSNSGPTPEAIMDEISKSGIKDGIHFVAFDVDADLFKPIREKGATVVGASNEKELNEKFDFILKEKILLERED